MIKAVKWVVVVWVVVVVAAARATAEDLPLSKDLVGDQFQYAIQRGDNFIKLGSRFGLGSAIVAAENGLQRESPLTAGKTLEIDNRHVVPAHLQDGIVVNIPQRMVFY